LRVLATERVLSGEPPVAAVRDLYMQIRAATLPHRVSLRCWWGRLLAQLELRRRESGLFEASVSNMHPPARAAMEGRLITEMRNSA
jgi:hypothetical protein